MRDYFDYIIDSSNTYSPEEKEYYEESFDDLIMEFDVHCIQEGAGIVVASAILGTAILGVIGVLIAKLIKGNKKVKSLDQKISELEQLKSQWENEGVTEIPPAQNTNDGTNNGLTGPNGEVNTGNNNQNNTNNDSTSLNGPVNTGNNNPNNTNDLNGPVYTGDNQQAQKAQGQNNNNNQNNTYELLLPENLTTFKVVLEAWVANFNALDAWVNMVNQYYSTNTNKTSFTIDDMNNNDNMKKVYNTLLENNQVINYNVNEYFKSIGGNDHIPLTGKDKPSVEYCIIALNIVKKTLESSDIIQKFMKNRAMFQTTQDNKSIWPNGKCPDDIQKLISALNQLTLKLQGTDKLIDNFKKKQTGNKKFVKGSSLGGLMKTNYDNNLKNLNNQTQNK